MTLDLDSATALAEDLLLGVRSDPEETRKALSDYVSALTPAGLAPGSAERLLHLSKLLHALDLRQRSLEAVRLALRQMEVAEAGPDPGDAALWSDAGALLAKHEQLDQARSVLVGALGKASGGTGRSDPSRARVLANLAAVGLRSGDTDDAGTWAGLAAEALDAEGEARGGQEDEQDAAVRLLVSWVLASVAKSRPANPGNAAPTGPAVAEFARAARRFTGIAGDDHPLSLAATFDLATTALKHAATTGDAEQAARGREALEVIALQASATFGAQDSRVLAARTVLANVEFGSTGDAASDLRRSSALATLDHIAGTTSAVLGVDHPQTLATLDSRARIPAELPPSLELPYHIERLYLPREGEERNSAKREALRREGSLVKVIAHAGASYLLRNPERFQPTIIEALDRHVHFEIIISNPWNSLGVFINRATSSEAGVTAENIVDLIKNSVYYRETFVAVTSEYQKLRRKYGERIELRLTPMDIPATTLLTSDVGFYEPYVTTDPEYRTSHGMTTFEVRFNRATRLYEDNLAGFATQWGLASKLDHFLKNEGSYQSRLRTLMTTLADDRKK